MNFLSIIPAQLIETTITNALLKGLTSPSQNKPFDPTPYQLYQMQQQQQQQQMNNSCNQINSIPTHQAPQAPQAPSAPQIHNPWC